MKHRNTYTAKKGNKNHFYDDEFPKIKLIKTKNQYKRKPKHLGKGWDSSE